MTQILYRKSMKTSGRISLQFTLWIAIISGVLLGILNSIFMYGWIRSETQNLTQFVVLKNLQPRNPITDSMQNQERVIAFDLSNFRPSDLPNFWRINRIRFFDGRRWLVNKNTNYYILLDVSQNINRQLGLLYISAISWFAVVLSSFIFGRFFVERSLRDLNKLAKNIRHRDVTKTNGSLIIEHLPEHDEINSIAKAIENLEHRIQGHYTNLRHFVGHVSHELKTPLMVMRSELDITERTKEYPTLITNMRNSIGEMQNMVDTLLILTRLQSQDSIDKNNINIYDMLHEVTSNMQKKYSKKIMQIHFTESSKEYGEIVGNEQFTKILINNIIDNARKYSPEHSRITINIEHNYLIIQNVGSISQDIIDNMRTPFWQADKNRGDGVGIGLSLVKEIVRLHKWEIQYSSHDNKVICTIHFNG